MRGEGDGSRDQILKVWVQPRASQNEILGYRGDFLRLRITAPPAAGEANRLLREVLAEALGISLSQVVILQGHKSRLKRVRIKDVNPADLEKLGRLKEKNP